MDRLCQERLLCDTQGQFLLVGVVKVGELFMVVRECDPSRPVLSLKSVDFTVMKYSKINNTVAAVPLPQALPHVLA